MCIKHLLCTLPGMGDMAMNETDKGTVSDMMLSQGWKSGEGMGEGACSGSVSSSIFLFAAIEVWVLFEANVSALRWRV